MDGSIIFNGIDFGERFGIMVKSKVELFAPKRERKISISDRNGQYDLGSEFYEERTVDLECYCVNEYTMDEFRTKVLGHLLKKGTLLLSGDSYYYVGEVFSPPQVTDDNLKRMKPFNIRFVCEPFLYSDTKTVNLVDGVTPFNVEGSTIYQGTEESPTKLSIVNKSNATLGNLKIVIRRRVN